MVADHRRDQAEASSSPAGRLRVWMKRPGARLALLGLVCLVIAMVALVHLWGSGVLSSGWSRWFALMGLLGGCLAPLSLLVDRRSAGQAAVPGADPAGAEREAPGLSLASGPVGAQAGDMLTLLLESTEEGVWFIDNDVCTTDANPAMCRMLGLSREQILGRSIYDFVDEDNAAIFRQQVQRRAQGLPGSYEIALRRADGSLVHCQNNPTPLFDARGVKIGAVGLFSDISSHKEAQAALHQASGLLAAKTRVLESTLDSLSQGVLSVGSDGRIEAWNQRALDLTQVPESLLQARPMLQEIVAWQLEQGLLVTTESPRPSNWLDEARDIVAGAPPIMWKTPHYQRQRNDGRIIEVQLHRAPGGAQVRTYTDVTDSVRAERALRASEVRFRTMADGAPALIWQSDADGTPVWFNEGWLRRIGRTLDEALRESWRERIAAADVERCRQAFDAARARREPFEVEYRLRVNGPECWIADRGIPSLDGEGRLEGYIAFGWDITTRKAAERSLIAARDEAERANRAKSEFLSRMSHELRTPLNAVLGFAQLIENDPVEPPGPVLRERIDQIQRGGAHLLTLINEVLDLARIESGALPILVEPVAVDDLLQDCLRFVGPMSRQRAIVLDDVEVPQGLGIVHTDATRLRQVLLNLLSNAIKYNRHGGKVWVAGHGDADRVRIEVHDDGPGLDEAQCDRLFQRFERLDADRRAQEGAGIGLALSKALVDLMGGRIGVRSSPGAGSTFWFELPRHAVGAPTAATASLDSGLQQDDAAPRPVAAASTPSPRVAPADGPQPPLRVLYIEDNRVNQILIESMLARLPMPVTVILASDPAAGLQAARDAPPDLVLLDIQLPGMSGFEVLAALRQLPATRAIPVIAVSANAMPEDLERARDAGFDDYVTKPVLLQQLLDAVMAQVKAQVKSQVKPT
jgi:PAS domain S-box-containing protein